MVPEVSDQLMIFRIGGVRPGRHGFKGDNGAGIKRQMERLML